MIMLSDEASDAFWRFEFLMGRLVLLLDHFPLLFSLCIGMQSRLISLRFHILCLSNGL
uniref:Uncharacterized protein n=1 Tax=Rhizophora mucronata TaxID=61149 RepID=A0A2P2N4G5_RHIMU